MEDPEVPFREKPEEPFRGKAGETGGIGNARCGYMPQQDMLFPWRTVAENVRLPLELRGGMQETEMNERVAEALKDVGLEGWGDKLPRELSGGMRQRASFARTLMTGADLLLLDEPFSALDYLTRLTMREWLLEQWEKDKKTVLFITHDVEEAVFLSNRILAVEHSPIRELREYKVPLSYPRTESALAAPEALALKEQLIRLFREAGK
ncbi:MAG: ATP-binding cassette domain-containing protein [Eubacteriales bacterium]|nr:ATP-binding cassette domain-containing protein [Eubacteriales bacterium]